MRSRRYNVFSRRTGLACPYFVPRERLDGGEWLHPSRLPLGAGWKGSCCVEGIESQPAESVVREMCNLGYAAGCPRLPANRDWDSVRFSVCGSGPDQIALAYVCERNHAPAEHGRLTFNVAGGLWREQPADPRLERLAKCYLETWRAKQIPGESQSAV
jgi:hypothetical protein